MNKIFFGVPILMLVVFAIIFWRFNVVHERALAQEAAEARAERVAELKKQSEERLKAAEEAKRVADENKRVREEEKAREERESKERQEAIARRDQVASDLARARRSLDDVKKDLAVEEAGMKRVTEDNAFLQAEKSFLREYVQRAEGNRQRMIGLVEKIDASAAKVVAELEAARNPQKAVR